MHFPLNVLVISTALASTDLFSICPAPKKGGEYLSTSDSAWMAVDDEPISQACEWSIDDYDFAERVNPSTVDIDLSTVEDGAPADFIYQSTNAWGISPSDVGLIGCNYVYQQKTYTNFIMQMDVIAEDNDAVGIVFGWQGPTDHYVAHNIDDSWPREGNALDGFPGPNMKIKRRFRSCVDYQSLQEPCFETLASLNDARGNHANLLSPPTIPSNLYAPSFLPYGLNTCDGVTQPTRYFLIVKDGTARFLRKVTATGQTVAVWTDRLGSQYAGGKIGLFTYAMQGFFYNLKVWDLNEVAAKDFCNGHGKCQDGLCVCKSGWDGSSCEIATKHHSSSSSKSKSSKKDSIQAITALTACSFVLNIILIAGLVLFFIGSPRLRGKGMLWSSPYAHMGQQSTTIEEQLRSPLAPPPFDEDGKR